MEQSILIRTVCRSGWYSHWISERSIYRGNCNIDSHGDIRLIFNLIQFLIRSQINIFIILSTITIAVVHILLHTHTTPHTHIIHTSYIHTLT